MLVLRRISLHFPPVIGNKNLRLYRKLYTELGGKAYNMPSSRSSKKSCKNFCFKSLFPLLTFNCQTFGVPPFFLFCNWPFLPNLPNYSTFHGEMPEETNQQTAEIPFVRGNQFFRSAPLLLILLEMCQT